MSRVFECVKVVIEVVGGSVKKVYYNYLGFKVLFIFEWFEKKGWFFLKFVCLVLRFCERVDVIGCLLLLVIFFFSVEVVVFNWEFIVNFVFDIIVYEYRSINLLLCNKVYVILFFLIFCFDE